MKKILLVLLIIILFVGCYIEPERDSKQTGELRHKLFVERMELAAKMPRQSDDDVGDVVSECSSQAYYMANHMSN